MKLGGARREGGWRGLEERRKNGEVPRSAVLHSDIHGARPRVKHSAGLRNCTVFATPWGGVSIPTHPQERERVPFCRPPRGGTLVGPSPLLPAHQPPSKSPLRVRWDPTPVGVAHGVTLPVIRAARRLPAALAGTKQTYLSRPNVPSPFCRSWRRHWP